MCRLLQITSLSFTRVSRWKLNGIWSFLRPCLQASRFPLKRVKDSSPFINVTFQVGLPCYLGLNSCGSVSIKVNKKRKHFSRNIHGACIFPKCFAVSHTGNIVSSVRFLFQDADYTYATRQGIYTKIRACEHSQKFCKHEQASTHLIFRALRAKAKFCEHFQIEWDHSIALVVLSHFPFRREKKTLRSLPLFT